MHPKRILSGVQPTGKPHLGNYFGAIKQHIELQHEAPPVMAADQFHAQLGLIGELGDEFLAKPKCLPMILQGGRRFAG